MAPFNYAEIGPDGIVRRVIVADSIDWVRTNQPTNGTWRHVTADETSPQYPGPGWTYDPGSGVFTAPPIDDPPPTET